MVSTSWDTPEGCQPMEGQTEPGSEVGWWGESQSIGDALGSSTLHLHSHILRYRRFHPYGSGYGRAPEEWGADVVPHGQAIPVQKSTTWSSGGPCQSPNDRELGKEECSNGE